MILDPLRRIRTRQVAFETAVEDYGQQGLLLGARRHATGRFASPLKIRTQVATQWSTAVASKRGGQPP